MQPLPFQEVYVHKLDLFLTRIKTAWKIIISKSAIVIIGNNVETFNISKTDTIDICSKLVSKLSHIRHKEAVIQSTINELIAK